ncbi:hypothetical protein BC941DRAFT_438361, partial [Chlamydoabsidia padenii]
IILYNVFSFTLSLFFPSLEPEFFVCSGCHTYRHPDMFVGRTCSNRMCSHCRHRQTPPTLAPLFEDMVDLYDLPIDSTFFSQSTTALFEANAFMDKHLLDLDYDAIDTENLEAVELKAGIGDTALSTAIVFFARCIQREDLHQTLDNDNRQRHAKLKSISAKTKIKYTFKSHTLLIMNLSKLNGSFD